MFGYIRPQESELLVRESRYYRAVYCGLCRAQGRCTGQCSRMTLSYDYVFLVLTRMALEGGNPAADGSTTVRFEARRCLPHPLRRRPSLCRGRVTEHVALCAAMLNYHKLIDDRADERRGSRAWWRAVLLYLPVRGMYRRACRRDGELAAALMQAMARFTAAEHADAPSADTPAAAFGEAVAVLLSHGLEDNARRLAEHIGFHVGKWLYFADALDDFDDDVRYDRPNPLRKLYGKQQLLEQNRQAVAVAMGAELRQADEALALCDVDTDACGRELAALLTHMLRVALPTVTGALADGSYRKQNKKKNDILTIRKGDDAHADRLRGKEVTNHDRSI